MVKEVDLLIRIFNELRDIKYWLQFSNRSKFRQIIVDNLRDDESKLVYTLSDGQRSTREIAKLLSDVRKPITHGTVANMWKRWLVEGLVKPSPQYHGRYEKLAELETLGIKVPTESKIIIKET